MDNTLKAVGIILGVVLIIVVIVWATGVEESVAPDQTNEEKSETKELKEAFIDSCVREGANREFCSCGWDSLMDQTDGDVSKFLEMEEKMNNGQQVDEVFQAINDCSHLLEVKVNYNDRECFDVDGECVPYRNDAQRVR